MADEVDLVQVDLPGGVSVKLPKADADKVIAGRQATKAEQATLNQRLGALEAEKNAEREARTKAETDAAHAAAIKSGEIDKAREIAAKSSNDKLAKLSTRYRDSALESLVRKVDGVVPDAVGDIVAQLKQSCSFNLDADTLEVTDATGKAAIGDDGKAISADAHIAKFLQTRPYFRLASAAPGSGHNGNPPRANTGDSMPASAFQELGAVKGAAFLAKGGKIVG